MKKNYFLFVLLMVAMAFIATDANSQIRYVDVDPGIGTLNDSIAGDTTATGDRFEPENTVYRLQRGNEAYYGLTGSISNKGYPLTIEAAEGDGARPFLQPRDEGDGSSRAFRPKGDITLKGLHVTNLDQLGGLNDRILRCDDDGIRVTLDDCWFDQASQSFIRVDDPDQRFFITNCVVSNIGQPKDPNNGRGIDDRGNDIDTIVMENCTFFNLTSRLIRDDGGTNNYVKINNCTMVNIGQMGITFGPTETMILTNNIAMNAGFVPKDDNDDWYVFSIDSVGDIAPVVTMQNNTAWLDTTKIAGFLNDTISITPIMNITLATAVFMAGDAEKNGNLKVEFTDGPPFNDSMVIYMYDPLFAGKDAPEWVVPEVPGVDAGGNRIYHLDVYYDFGYANSIANTAATDGLQLGDRNWTSSPSVSVKPMVTDDPGLSVYPVPARDQVTINFTLKADAMVQMELFNMAGQRVADVMHSHYHAGSHQFSWSVDRVETGMYLLRVNTGNDFTTIKLIVQ